MLRLLSVVLLSFLSFADAPDLTGTWTWVDPASREPFTITFAAGGRGTYDGEKMTFQIAGDRLTIRADGEDIAYTFVLRDGKLVLSGGDLEAPSAFTRQGNAPPAEQGGPAQEAKPDDAAKPNPAADNSIVGKWDTAEGILVFNPDGTGTLGAKPFKYEIRDGVIVMVGEKESDIVPFRLLDGGRMEVVVDGERVVLNRAGAKLANAPAGGGNATGAGVYVCTESSVDPNILMTFTQYVVLWPDGTVSYAKSEGGATRTQVTESTERFSAYRTNPEVKGQTVGRWESDGRNIVVRWELWNGLVCEGQFDGAGNLQLSKMGVLEEGATLTFQKQ